RYARDVDVRELLELVVHARQLATDVFVCLRHAFADPRDVEEHPAVRTAAPFTDLADDAARHVVAGEQLRRPPRVPVTLRVLPSLVRRLRRLPLVERSNVV